MDRRTYRKEPNMEVFEALETARAMRYLKPDPLPEDVLRKLVWAATRASSPGNSQGWEFVVVRERAIKERLGAAVRERMGQGIRAMPAESEMQLRMLAGANHLLEHFAEVPAWILICGRTVYPPQAPSKAMVWSTVYPAGQNLIVAARALGLGATFTTFHLAAEAEFREALGIPAEVVLGVSVAVGYPARAHGPVNRKPVEAVLHWERW
jgi:nitroreductase